MTLLVVVSFCGLGRLCIGADPAGRLPATVAFRVIAGWALTSHVLILASLAGLSLRVVGITVLGVGLCGLAVADRAVRRTDAFTLLGGIVALCASLLTIAATAPSVMFDDLGHWLPNARFVFEQGSLPTAQEPLTWSVAPGYPYGGPFVNVLASFVRNDWSSVPIVLFTILNYGLFGAMLADETRASRQSLQSVWLTAAGMVVAIMINPAFDPRIAMSAHMDSVSGVLAAFAGLALWQASVAFANGNGIALRMWSVRAGVTGLALVMTRETNPVLLAGLWLGLIAVSPGMLTQRRPMAAVFLLPLAGFGFWRWYLWYEAIPAHVTVRAVREWQWDAGTRLVSSTLLERLPAHPWLGGMAILMACLVLVGALLTVSRSPRADRGLVVMAGITASVWMTFLLWTYIATAADDAVATANSLWRFLGQLSPLCLLTFTPLVRRLAAHAASGSLPWTVIGRYAGVVAALALVGVPLARPRYWQNACRYPDITEARAIAANELVRLGSHDRVLVVHTSEADWLKTAVSYEQQVDHARLLRRNAATDVPIATIAVEAGWPEAVFDFRAIERGRLVSGLPPAGATLYRRQPAFERPEYPATYSATTIAAGAIAWGCRFPPQ